MTVPEVNDEKKSPPLLVMLNLRFIIFGLCLRGPTLFGGNDEENFVVSVPWMITRSGGYIKVTTVVRGTLRLDVCFSVETVTILISTLRD